MAKKELTEEQKAARKARAKARREKRRAAAAATPDTTVTEATSEDDILSPVKSKKQRKSKKDRKAEREANAVTQEFLLFKDTDSLRDFSFHRFTDNDNFKTAYFLESCNGKNIMRGTFVKITPEGKIDPCDYSKLEAAEKEDGFIGWIKDPSYSA